MIKFPKMHIAESVLNRIANTLEQDGPLGFGAVKPAAPQLQEPPEVPNPAMLGTAVEQQVSQPLAPVGVDPEMAEPTEQGMVQASAMGGSPFDGALVGGGL